MKFVLSTIGSAGDVFPMMGLAITLKKRGHEVLLATNSHFAAVAERHEIPFEPLGSSEEYLNCIQSPNLWHPQKAFKHVYNFFRPILKRQYDVLVEQAAAGPVVGISSCLCFGTRLAQETHAIPVLTVHVQPAVIWSDVQPPVVPGLVGPRWLKSLIYRLGEKFAVDGVVCPFLNEWRRELKLPPIKRITRWWNSPSGVLCLFPEWFTAPQADWPTPLMQTDFPLWNDQSDKVLAPEVHQFLESGSPPLAFTPGSANVHGRSFFETALEACQKLNRRAIFLTRHPEQLPSAMPKSVLAVSYAPLDILLPRCAAFVHHGGVGSTSQAFLAGIPQIAMPLAHDQFDNAGRICELNAGRGLPAKQFKSPALIHFLGEILDSEEVLSSCRKLGQRLASRSGLDDSVDAIEQRFCNRPVKA